MARNVIQSEFRTSKMADGSHFVNKMEKKVSYWSEMARNAIQSYFWTSKMATGGHFLKNIYKKSCASDLNNVRTDCWPTTTWYKFTFGQYIYTYRHLCCERGNIHCVRPLGRMHTILVYLWVLYNILLTRGLSALPFSNAYNLSFQYDCQCQVNNDYALFWTQSFITKLSYFSYLPRLPRCPKTTISEQYVNYFGMVLTISANLIK